MLSRNSEDVPPAAIVVPCCNSQGTVGACVEACLSQDYPHLEIIFVDDGSTDDTLSILERYDGITVLQQQNRGPAAARNAGWKNSSAEIICFTDSDCIPNPRWVSGLVWEYTRLEIAAVGGSYDIANPNSWLATCIQNEIRIRHTRMSKSVDYLGSFNVSYRRSVLEQVGGFDETFTRASAEDNDLSYRAKKLGKMLIFDRDNLVAHHHEEGFWRYMRQQFWHGYWRIRLYLKHPDTLGGDQYAGLSDFLQLPLALITGLTWLFSWVSVIVLSLALLFAITILILQIPITLSIVRGTGDVRTFPYAFILAARAFSRGIGMVGGLLSSSPSDIQILIKAFMRLFNGGEGSVI